MTVKEIHELMKKMEKADVLILDARAYGIAFTNSTMAEDSSYFRFFEENMNSLYIDNNKKILFTKMS